MSNVLINHADYDETLMFGLIHRTNYVTVECIVQFSATLFVYNISPQFLSLQPLIDV